MAKANQIQWRRSGEFEARIGSHPLRKLLRELHVPAHMMPQALHTVVANHEPQLESAKAPPERDLPVAVVNYRTRFRSAITQVFRQHAQCANKSATVANVEAVTIEIREHPFMRIEAIAVGQFDAVVRPAKFGADCGCARHSRINVEPEPLSPRN